VSPHSKISNTFLSLFLGLYNVAHETTRGAMDNSFPRLAQMIMDYENPIKKMTEEFIPLSKVSWRGGLSAHIVGDIVLYPFTLCSPVHKFMFIFLELFGFFFLFVSIFSFPLLSILPFLKTLFSHV